MNVEVIAGVKLSDWPVDLATELKEVKIHVALASMLFAYTLAKVDIRLADHLPNGSPAAAIVHGDKNIITFTRDGFTKFAETSQQRAFILVHELYHIFFQHHGRMNDAKYHPFIWNYATDYYNNLKASGVFVSGGAVVRDERYAKHFQFPSGGGLYDEKYLGMSCDEIYDLLHDAHNDGSAVIDMSGYESREALGDNDSYSDIIGDGGSIEQQRKNQQTLSGAAVASRSALSPEQLAGSMDGDLVRMINGMMKPVIPWEDKFTNAVRSKTRTKRTYNIWNKLSASDGNGPIFKSYYGEKINFVYGIDSSGSMCETSHNEARSELYGLIETLDGWSADVVCCDTKLHKMGIYSSEDGDEFNDIEFTVRGLGGTILSPILDHAEQAGYSDELNAIIIVTDGYFDGEELDRQIAERGDLIPVIVIIVRGGCQDFALENAEVIHIE